MSTEDAVTIDEETMYLRRMKRGYVQANRRERGRLLVEMEAITGKHRRSLIRLMNSGMARKTRCRQRGNTCGPKVDDDLGIIAESLDTICADRLTPHLVWMATHLAAHGEMETSQEVLEQPGQVSIPR